MRLRRVLPGRRESKFALALVLAVTVLGTATGYAAAHWGGGGSSWGSDMRFEAVIVGLGSNAPYVEVVVDGTMKALCENQGGKKAPGRNDIAVSISAQLGPFPVDENGRAEIDEVIPGPTSFGSPSTSPTPKQAGCPNGNWVVVGPVPNTENWESLTAFALATIDPRVVLDVLRLKCTTSFNPNGTTFGVCVEA